MNERNYTILNGEEVRKDIPKRKINKANVKKFAIGTALLASIAGSVGGICVYDAHIDHTEEICKISSLLNYVNFYDDNMTVGYRTHQIPAMKEDYAEKGYENVDVQFGDCIVDEEVRETIDPVATVHYFAPSGYTLTKDENGNNICVKENVLVVNCAEELPAGYTLINVDENGNKHGVKITSIPAEAITEYTVPSGFVLTKNENGNIIGIRNDVVEKNLGKGFIIYSDNNGIEYKTEISLARRK